MINSIYVSKNNCSKEDANKKKEYLSIAENINDFDEEKKKKQITQLKLEIVEVKSKIVINEKKLNSIEGDKNIYLKVIKETDYSNKKIENEIHEIRKKALSEKFNILKILEKLGTEEINEIVNKFSGAQLIFQSKEFLFYNSNKEIRDLNLVYFELSKTQKSLNQRLLEKEDIFSVDTSELEILKGANRYLSSTEKSIRLVFNRILEYLKKNRKILKVLLITVYTDKAFKTLIENKTLQTISSYFSDERQLFKNSSIDILSNDNCKYFINFQLFHFSNLQTNS